VNVYVESNFILEHVLEQEQCDSCRELIEISRSRLANLIVPAFSLAEPHIALMKRHSDRNKWIDEMRRQVKELSRSRPYKSVSGTAEELRAVLASSIPRELGILRDATAAILQVAEVIPLEFPMLQNALAIQAATEISFQDSVVLASVQWHMTNTKPGQSCFLNRNSADFDIPLIREMLSRQGCRLFSRFDQGVEFIKARLRENPPSPAT
jgi:hypothetical protein